MAYTVLARKYRSTTFDELIGQEHISRTLKKAIGSGRIAHAFLFCGTRGTGKTSTARILAKCLNCQSGDKPAETPCNKCASCLAITRGEDMSVIEIDAASNTGVDNIREVIEGAYNSPPGRFKIYIIDEVHMLSKSAFNALLKTLEEPPAHVKFILATTEPEKVLATILSRCQRYDFRNIPTREIADHLKEICKKEKIKADDDALLLVAKAGAGSMRDSLSLLDRLLSLGEKDLTVEMIEQLLGLPKTALLFNLADAIGQGDVASTLQQTESIIAGGLSVDSLIASLVDHLRNLLILRTCGAQSKLVEVPGLPVTDLVKQAERFDAMTLSQDIAILEELRRQVRVSQAGRALVDATMARLALAEQFASVSDLLAGGGPPGQKKKSELTPSASPEAVRARLRDAFTPSPGTPGEGGGEGSAARIQTASKGDRTLTQPSPGVQGEGFSPDTQSTPSDESSFSPHPGPLPAGEREEEADALPEVGKVFEGPKRSMFAAFKASAPAKPQAVASNIESVGESEFSEKWAAVLASLKDDSPGVHGILSQGRLLGVENGAAVVEVNAQLEGLIKSFDRNGKKELIRGKVAESFGEGVGIAFRIGAATETTTAPLAASRATASAKPQAATAEPVAPIAPPPPRLTAEQVDAAKKDPYVKAVLEQFGGTIVKVESY